MVEKRVPLEDILVLPLVLAWRGWVTIWKLLQIGENREDTEDCAVATFLLVLIPSLVYVALPNLILVPLVGKVIIGGMCAGVLTAPFVGWRHRKLGARKVISRSVLSVLVGAWVPYLLIAMLAVAASD